MKQRSGSIKLQILSLLLFVASSGIAQNVVICKRFTNTGQPKSVMTEIVADSLPLQLKVIYNNGKTTIDKSKLNMLIEVEDGKKIPAQAFYVNVSQGRNWVGADIEFNYAGDHVISAFSLENKILASTKFKITLKAKEAPTPVFNDATLIAEVQKKETPKTVEKVVPKVFLKKDEPIIQAESEPTVKELATGFDTSKKVEITEEEAKTLYYEGAKLEFGKAKGSKGLEGKDAEFKLLNGRADVTGLLINQLPIKTKMLQVDIWQQGKDGSFSELTVSEEHACNPKFYKTFFPIKFYREGKYKVSVYSDDFVWINSGYVTIIK
jgi:hypothetical protein